MSFIPQTIKGLTHPLIKNAFMKKQYKNGHSEERILVLETFPLDDVSENESFDLYLLEVLSDLKNLDAHTMEQIGSYDRIDIRTH